MEGTLYGIMRKLDIIYKILSILVLILIFLFMWYMQLLRTT